MCIRDSYYAPVNITFNEDVYLAFSVYNNNIKGSLKELKDRCYIYEYYMFNDGELVSDDEKADQFIIYMVPTRYVPMPSYNKFEEMNGVREYHMNYFTAQNVYFENNYKLVVIEPTMNELVNEYFETTSYSYGGVNCPIITNNTTTINELKGNE